MKLPGNEECQMSSYFVCNNIGTSSAVFPHRIRGNYIEEATLQKIRKFDRRGEIRYAILIGACGYGKTSKNLLMIVDIRHRNSTLIAQSFIL